MKIHDLPEILVRTEAGKARVVMRDSAHETELPALWLRARSTDPSQRDTVTGQRLMNPHLLPDDLHLLGARVEKDMLHLSFSDGFSGHFDPQELLQGIVLSTGLPPVRAWRADLQRKPIYVWADLQNDEMLYRALKDFIELGFLLVNETPTQTDSILRIAERFGIVRTTNFGDFFEVYSRPESNDLAYRPVALGPHTDNPYRTPVPGIQILQCLQNETSGGFSTLVDSLAVAEQVRAEDPEGFDLLSRIPVRFEYRDASTHLVSVKPLVELDGEGHMTGVHYSPRLDDIPLMSQEDTVHYHRARKRLGTLFEDPAYELRFRLNAGEMMMFDNNRILHGRTSFNPSEGHRQLQGCYVDRDGPRSHYLVLQRSWGHVPGKE